MRTLLSLLLLCLMHHASAQCNPVITPLGNTTFCDGNSVTLNASLGDTYQWYLNGNLINGAQNNSYIASVAGSYTVEVDSVGCVNMSPAVGVTVNTAPAQPGAITISDDSVCDGDMVTFSIDPVPGATSYDWFVQCNNPIFQLNTTISFTTQIEESYGNNTPNTGVAVRAVNSCGMSTETWDSLAIYSPRNLNGMNNDPDITYLGVSPYICPNSLNNELNAFSHPQNWGYSPTPAYQWYRNNVLIPGATGYSLYINRGGLYKVVLNTGNGACIQTIQKPIIHQIVPIVDSAEVLTPQPMCEGGVALLKVDFDFDGYDGADFYWWWSRNDTGIASPPWGTQYIVVSHPGEYKIGSWGYGYMNNLIQCPTSPVLANVSLSNNQAIPVYVIQNGMTLSATSGFASYQWFRNTTPINGATSQDYTMTTWGDYFVLATDANDCVSQSNIVLDVNNVGSSQTSIQVYPNPNTGLFTIIAKLPMQDNKVMLNLTDISGRVVLTKEILIGNSELNESIDISTYSSGLYFLKLTSGNFNKVVSIVKQ